jgi:hypothetical protein
VGEEVLGGGEGAAEDELVRVVVFTVTNDEKTIPSGQDIPAFLAFQLKVRRALHLVLVFEADLLGFGCLAAGSAHFDLALVEPALIDGRFLDVVCFGHTVVELELFHEAIVGLAEGPRLANLCQGLAGCDAISLHEEGAGHCGRS